MAKLSPRFVTYFIFASLALAFIFPITHSAYEGLENKGDDEYNTDLTNAKNALSMEIVAQARANISQSTEDIDKATVAQDDAEEKKRIAIESKVREMTAAKSVRKAAKAAKNAKNQQ